MTTDSTALATIDALNVGAVLGAENRCARRRGEGGHGEQAEQHGEGDASQARGGMGGDVQHGRDRSYLSSQ